MTIPELSQRERKLIASLRIKKYRDREGLFLAEGDKVIEQLATTFVPRLVVSERLPWAGVSETPPGVMRHATATQLQSMTTLQTAPTSIAAFELPQTEEHYPPVTAPMVVALDAVQNPGNLGTIIRLCDWLGVRHLVLGEGTVDPFSPKVVQATAGALGAVHLYRDVDLVEYVSLLDTDVQVIATGLEGATITEVSMPERCVILFGNEGHGLSSALMKYCTQLINIPSAPGTVSESLNVSISAAIVLAKFAGIV